MNKSSISDIATEIFKDQFVPALRSMIAAVIETARRGRLTASAYARFAAVVSLTDTPVVSAEKLFGEWQDSLTLVCRAVVKAGLIQRNDPLFDGFDF